MYAKKEKLKAQNESTETVKQQNYMDKHCQFLTYMIHSQYNQTGSVT